ncbi:MAG TPA: hypothetical protein VFC93_15725 [Chloroflexota bacterium]|nr:hypothetical protein [Chloroflexota bacterium]
MKARIALAVIGILVAVAVARAALQQGRGADDVAVDTTGATAGQRGATPVSAAATAATGTAAGRPAGTVASSSPTVTPVTVQVAQGNTNAAARKPLVLLNPGTVRQGSSVGISGSGFDAGAAVDLLFKRTETDQGQGITFVQIDKSGAFGNVAFTVPDTMATGSFIVEARQRQSDKVAFAVGVIAGGAPKVKLGIGVGKPGDVVELTAQGFSRNEAVNVYWNGLDGKIVGTLQSDPDGNVARASVRVPFGAVGNNAFVFVGQQSQSPVTVPFLLLNLFPSVDLSSYAIRADNVLSFSGKDFGPGEQIEVHLNTPDGPPIATLQAEDDGTFLNAGSVLIPFGLNGRQTLIFIGDESRAPATATFDIQPYTPNAQPSTYGGRPGTAVTFYATGFARSETVFVYIGRNQTSEGQMVSCFGTNAQGNAAAAGSYVIPGDATPGQQVFTLIGHKSGGIANAAIEVMASDVPIETLPQPEFQCTLDDGGDDPAIGQMVQVDPSTVLAAPAANVPPAAPKPNAAPPVGQRTVAQPAQQPAAQQAAPAGAAAQPVAPLPPIDPTAGPNAAPPAPPNPSSVAPPAAPGKPDAAPKPPAQPVQPLPRTGAPVRSGG